ncbi:MAG: pyridoxal phosphate-dependent aminotransferase [Kiritimatiellia bacterium]|nr:pyridoxal phosphate-dependent aminotransferase [Kiritimatiellia bacterium]
MKTVSDSIAPSLSTSSAIRKMFEAGLELKKKFGAENVFDFSLGNPDVPPPAKTREALARIAQESVRPCGLGYMPNAGLPELREALACKLTREQALPLSAQDIIVTVGAAGALTVFFRAILDPGDEVLVTAPYFVEYGAYCGHFGGILKPVPALQPDFRPDLEAIAAAITPKTRAIIVNSPNNPTGCVYTPDTIAALGELLQQVNQGRQRPVFLLSDEPYRAIAYDGVQVPPILPASPFAAILGSFSKSLSMAGERIGYIAVNPDMPGVEPLRAALVLVNRTLGYVNAPIIGQKLALALLDEQVDLDIYARRRTAMVEVLRAAGLDFPEPKGAFYIFAKVPDGNDKAFCERLLQENILAVPGTGFGCPGYIRLCYAVDESIIRRSAPAWLRAVQA